MSKSFSSCSSSSSSSNSSDSKTCSANCPNKDSSVRLTGSKSVEDLDSKNSELEEDI